MADQPDDTLEQVRNKERRLAELNRPGGPLEQWKLAADLWCAAWFASDLVRDRATFQALLDHILQRAGPLPEHTATGMLRRARDAAAADRYFHWTLEFPEVFFDAEGFPLVNGGFDVVVTNPPWDMLRKDEEVARNPERLAGYVAGGRQYRLQSQGHTNLYQLFFERAGTLLRRGGRCGMVVPAGFATDQGCGMLRRHTFTNSLVDTFATLDNRDGIFPIHRGLKFLLLTFTTEGRTDELPVRTGIHRVESLDLIPDDGRDAEAVGVRMDLIRRSSGESMAVPEIRSQTDLAVMSRVTLTIPASADPAGWNIHFGRELNATDDRRHFNDSAGLPVVEGKHLRPFGVDLDSVRYRIPTAVAARLLERTSTFGRARLGYRDVASPANRLTLIAAIVPAGSVTTHTVFCIKEQLKPDEQQYLCGILNSYVANYLVRMRVGTHVTTAILAHLPIPRPARADRRFRAIAENAAALRAGDDRDRLAQLNAAAAELYELTVAEFSHVLRSFPLIPEADREAALVCFSTRRIGR
jgi:hypothetical protein